jgi:hypothetical protein
MHGGFSNLLKALIAGVALTLSLPASAGDDSSGSPTSIECKAYSDKSGKQLETVCADVVALDQTLVYNRFGSFNPFGMMYALRRDVVPSSQEPTKYNADKCDSDLGVQADPGALEAGNVRLRDCKRPRPLTLRANVGQVLHLRLTNLLQPKQPGFSESFCRQGGKNKPGTASGDGNLFHFLRNWVSEGLSSQEKHGEVSCESRTGAEPQQFHPDKDNEYSGDWPRTRGLNFSIQGLHAIPAPDEEKPNKACIGLEAIDPGKSVDCYYKIDREGPYFMASTAAPSGGQGDGGSLTHGLFGAVIAEQSGTQWYRSQVSKGVFDAVWKNLEDSTKPHARMKGHVQDMSRYEVAAYYVDKTKEYKFAETADEKAGTDLIPLLNMRRKVSNGVYEIVHSDLNAIIYRKAEGDKEEVNFREFSVFFHDELKTFYTRNFEELGKFGGGQLAGVRDGFGINYGASGMGAMLLANRKGIGPAANCVECFYEEFFLTSWANGDPALLEQFSDDPSNVHHSYLNDRVVFRNFHAGPKETHVFHLHAHQWFAGNDANRGSYLDSQTVAPQQGFTYNIYEGGQKIYRKGKAGKKGWYETLGSGNRNRTAGDSIFHCHLYPHFAQGMWELWRVHDVLEDGSRKLADGQWEPTLSLAEMDLDTRKKKRPGSVDHDTGARIEPGLGYTAQNLGTPVPAVVPLPGQAWPLLPTYSGQTTIEQVASKANDEDKKNTDSETPITSFPGYPYYIAGKAGHRPPQPPMDIARKLSGETVTDKYLDGGLPRHVMLDKSKRDLPFSVRTLPEALDNVKKLSDALNGGKKKAREIQQSQIIAKALALGDMTLKLKEAELKLLPYDGTNLEVAAQQFHFNGGSLDLKKADGSPATYDTSNGGYSSLGIAGSLFPVNGAPAKPGAPFADPCGAPKGYASRPDLEDEIDPFLKGKDEKFTADPGVNGFRRYEASAVQVDMITNRAGWHDPQARINVLTEKSDQYKDGDGRISPKVSGSEQPFFFRALSGECIEFRHTNELPKELQLDDFQVKTPTDTIGQHIHLVKFDVTSSDGSGNGFNYEDGTFAPDEIAARICAAKNVNQNLETIPGTKLDENLKVREFRDLCEKIDDHWEVSKDFKDKIWKMKRGDKDKWKLFQTTVQRWFADPILSDLRAPEDGDKGTYDRTLRTVFSHDHFGPSSIQQHGFYTALLIEPQKSVYCDPGETSSCSDQRINRELRTADARDVGTRKVIINPEGIDGKEERYREFAISIADFATLYDPRDRMTAAEVTQTTKGQSHKGMATLYCEHKLAMEANSDNLRIAKRMKEACGSDFQTAEGGKGIKAGEGDVPPAWFAAGMPGDVEGHRSGLRNDLLVPEELEKLKKHLISYRRKAAGYPEEGGNENDRHLAKPVAAPQRPESISVDHHDPYLVNYRGEPIPLRIGTDKSSSKDCDLKPSFEDWQKLLTTGVKKTCSIKKQKRTIQELSHTSNYDLKGNLAEVFRSGPHGDPVTPILRAIEKDPIQVRLIQGAQEVQHTYILEGYNWPRNIDQDFPSGAPELDQKWFGTLSGVCQQALNDNLRWGRPDEVSAWLKSNQALNQFWQDREKLLASCFNAQGRITAQEIGISEHFEFAGAYDYTTSGFEGLLEKRATPPQSDTLFHFGSVDALWNGAWGLLRVFKETSDSFTDSDEYLLPLKDYEPNLAMGAQKAGTPGDETGKPYRFQQAGRSCAPGAPQKYAVVAAVETQQVFNSRGLRYAKDLYDQNGLMLSLIDPSLITFGDTVGMPGFALAVQQLQNVSGAALDATTERSKIIRALKRQFGSSHAQPFVLPVNAGDCVHLLVINALRDWKGKGGLLDDLGDSLMPKIVPLNVEAAWDEKDETRESKNNPKKFKSEKEHTVRGSAHFGLSLPLPVLNFQHSVSRPFGRNQTGALEPKTSEQDMLTSKERNIELLTFYAGRAVVYGEEVATPREVEQRILNRELPETYADGAGEKINDAVEALRVSEAEVRQSNDKLRKKGLIAGISEPGIQLVQRNNGIFEFSITEPKASQYQDDDNPDADTKSLRDMREERVRTREIKRLEANKVLEQSRNLATISTRNTHNKEAVKYIPYAFGSLPIKSVGDMISHATHGLIGAINVVPQGASIETPGIEFETLAGGGKVIKPAGRTGMGRAAVSVLVTPSPDHWAYSHTIREFTLFWQDGLGMRDHKSRDTWEGYDPHNPGSGKLYLGGKNLAPGLVANCEICDDSYDWGERGASYRSEPFHRRLRDTHPGNPPEIHYNLNKTDFGKDFFLLKDSETGANANPPMHVLRAREGEEVVIHVVHPGGRARQRLS